MRRHNSFCYLVYDQLDQNQIKSQIFQRKIDKHKYQKLEGEKSEQNTPKKRVLAPNRKIKKNLTV